MIISPINMKDIEQVDSLEVYIVPSSRIIEIVQELSFLTSNLEPIGGGDDPDIDW